LGHIHRREVLCEDPWVVFSGNVQARHARETGSKGCMLVTVNDRLEVACQHHPLDVVRWEICRVDATGLALGEDLLDRLRARLGEFVRAAEGRPLAVRVEVSGACAAHRLLAGEPLRWTNEVRAAAADVGDVWIEKVTLDTSLPAEVDQAALLDGPLGELIHYVRQLKATPEEMTSLAAKLSDLKDKLPAELQEGDEALGFDRPEVLGPLLDQVEQMLVHQLTARVTPA
jgi:exonuclease SbcD